MEKNKKLERELLKRYGKNDIDGPMLQNFRVEFEAGFLAGIEQERERAKGLVLSLKDLIKGIEWTGGGSGFHTAEIQKDLWFQLMIALEHYQGEGNG